MLFYFGTGLDPLWPLLWLAPIPVLWAAQKLRPWPAFLLVCLTYAAGAANLFVYLGSVAVPIPVRLLAMFVPGLWYGFCAWRLRGGGVSAPFEFAAYWTIYEFAHLRFSPHGSFGSLAYSQTGCLPILQLASLTGVLGISFLLMLVPAAVVVGLRDRRALVLPAVLLAAALVYGGVRLSRPQPARVIHAGLAVSDATVRYFRTEDPAETMKVVEVYADRVRRLAQRGAEVVVLPEKFVGVTPAARESVYQVLDKVAREKHVVVVAGLNLAGRKPMRNIAAVFPLSLEYDKLHFVPVLEDGYAPGPGPLHYENDGVSWGVAICKDLDFPDYLRRYAAARPDVLLVPAWDFVADGKMHSRMAVVRGVELGAGLIRTAQEGLLTVSDAQGRIVEEASSSESGEVLLTADLHVQYEPTYYSRWGDWVGWLSLLVAAALSLKR